MSGLVVFSPIIAMILSMIFTWAFLEYLESRDHG